MRFLLLLLISLFFVACSKPTTPREKDNRPNVVIILADDQGWGDLSLNGNPVVQTKHIDSLAASGLVLSNFLVEPVCSPTRASLLTGRYAVRSGVRSTSAGGERMDLDEYTLAQAFLDAGYKTGAFGKWHNGMQPPYHPNYRGFEDFVGYCSGHWGSYVDALLERNREFFTSKGYLTDVLTDECIQFMEKNRDTPFLAYLALNTPHSPMQVPDSLWDQFSEKEWPEHRYSEKEDINHSRAAYAMAKNIDDNVGKVLASLEEAGLRENTIIIYFSDNGPNGNRSNGGMKGHKGSTDEGGVRSPFVISWPEKIARAQNEPYLSSVIDIFPSLVGMAGLEYHEKKPFDGQDISGLLLGLDSLRWDRTVVNHWQGKTSIRTQDFRLDHEGNLFDLKNDPGQLEPVNETQPKLRDSLLAFQAEWLKSVGSELPPTENRPITIMGDKIQIPARDGLTTGNIKRSNRWPNCSFFTNWTQTEEEINWPVEIMEKGTYELTIFVTLPKENVGVEMGITLQGDTVKTILESSFDSPLRGAEFDRIPRQESLVKDFMKVKVGQMNLEAGRDTLRLIALDIPGEGAVDFRMMRLDRIEE
ncbi:MAG: arylsulfatase [Bacteroidota bacterium]